MSYVVFCQPKSDEVLAEAETGVYATNRNFKGRNSDIYL